ncbi:hypothetical protein ACKKBF_B40320 [Auxenochlorella protothecoides x Auxenochlorella symbiontica]
MKTGFKPSCMPAQDQVTPPYPPCAGLPRRPSRTAGLQAASAIAPMACMSYPRAHNPEPVDGCASVQPMRCQRLGSLSIPVSAHAAPTLLVLDAEAGGRAHGFPPANSRAAPIQAVRGVLQLGPWLGMWPPHAASWGTWTA